MDLHRLYMLAMEVAEDENEKSRLFLAIDGAHGWLEQLPAEYQQLWLCITLHSYHAEIDSTIFVTVHMATSGDRRIGVAFTIRGNRTNACQETDHIVSVMDAISVVPGLDPKVIIVTASLVLVRQGKEQIRSEQQFGPNYN